MKTLLTATLIALGTATAAFAQDMPAAPAAAVEAVTTQATTAAEAASTPAAAAAPQAAQPAAPAADYPPCKKGVTDMCRESGGKAKGHRAGAHHRRHAAK